MPKILRLRAKKQNIFCNQVKRRNFALPLTNPVMAVTTLQRKVRRRRAKSVQRIVDIKLITKRPVIKNVDVEAIKAEFAAKKAASSPAKSKKSVAVEAPVEIVAAPVASVETQETIVETPLASASEAPAAE